MKHLLTILLSAVVSIGCIYYYDSHYVRNYTEFKNLTIVDSAGKVRAQLGNFEKDDIKKIGLAIYDTNGNMREFVGIADAYTDHPDNPHLSIYDENQRLQITMFAFENSSMIQMGNESRVRISTDDNDDGATNINLQSSGENGSEINIFSGKQPTIALENKLKKSMTLLHSTDSKPSVIVVNNGKRVWTSPESKNNNE